MKTEIYEGHRAALANVLLNGELPDVHMGDEVFEYVTEGMTQEEKGEFYLRVTDARYKRVFG